MTKYYAGPWQWNSSESNPHYHAPAGSSALIDLRTMAAQSAANHANGVGNGFFCTPDDVTLPSEYDLLGQGYITEVTTNNAVKAAWQALYGVVPQGDKLIDYLSYTLGNGSDPDGDTAPKPLMPGVSPQSEVQIVLSGHSVVYRRKMNLISGPSEHAKKCRIRMQKDLETIAETDEELFRKCLGKMKQKFGLAWGAPQEDFLLTTKTKAKGKGSNGKTIAERPATTYTESWPTAGAITSSQDRAWSYMTGWQSGGMSVTSNQVACTSSNGTRYCRMGSALSGSDVYCQLVYKSFTGTAAGNTVGPLGRKSSADGTVTFYRHELYSAPVSSTYSYLYKVITGTSTDLGFSAVYSLAANDVIKLELDGSTLNAYTNASLKKTVTDTAISSGEYCGLASYGSVSDSHVTDDWECGDLGGGGGVVIPVFMNQYRQRWR